MPVHPSGSVTHRISRAMVGVGLTAALTLGLAGPSGAQGAIEDLQRQIEEAQRQQQELGEEIGKLDNQQSGLERQGGDLSASWRVWTRTSPPRSPNSRPCSSSCRAPSRTCVTLRGGSAPPPQRSGR